MELKGLEEKDYQPLDMEKLEEDLKEIVTTGYSHVEEDIKERNTSFINQLEQQAKVFSEANPGFDMLTLTKRPEGMSWELYKFIRKVSNKTLKRYIKR
jgi:hypothetical protein